MLVTPFIMLKIIPTCAKTTGVDTGQKQNIFIFCFFVGHFVKQRSTYCLRHANLSRSSLRGAWWELTFSIHTSNVSTANASESTYAV